VTRAIEAALIRFRHNAARQVSALPAECSETLLIEPQQRALVVFVRIGEIQNAPDADVVYARNELERQLPATRAKIVLDNYPELPNGEGKTCQHQELGKVTTGDVMILRPVYRKVLMPLRLLGIGSTIG